MNKVLPEVWVVRSAFPGGNIDSKVCQTEEEARKYYNEIPTNWFREIYKTDDIWGMVKKELRFRVDVSGDVLIVANFRTYVEAHCFAEDWKNRGHFAAISNIDA